MEAKSRFPGRVLPYLLLMPTIIVCIVFLYYPTFQTFILSLHRVAFLGLRKVYVGFENYRHLFTSADYARSVTISLLFSAGVVFIGLSISLVLAVVANQKLRGARIYRMLLIWPYALSPAVAATIWLFLFNPTVGFINYILDVLFGVKPNWINNGTLALVMVMLTATWKNLGYNIVFYLAALQNIPGELLEAAEIDGAGALRKFWHVTFPLLSPTTFFLFIMNLIYSFFGTFAVVDIMTGGGPNDATNLLIYNLYRDAFEYYKTGLAAAQSVILFILVVMLTLIQFRTTERRVHYGAA